jgi:DNA-directed RNA polymerase specialized sigma24 family protein
MRACFILFAVEEFKLEEVGEMLGLRLGTVKATIHRARARLRSILMDAGSSEDSKP